MRSSRRSSRRPAVSSSRASSDPSRRAARRTLFPLFSLLLLAGCAALPPPREASHPLPPEQAKRVLALLHAREGQLRSLRGMAMVEVTLKEETRRLREAVALRWDGRFRFETLGAMGLPALTVASDGAQVIVRDGTGRGGTSEDGRDILNRLFGLPLSPLSLARLLSGLPPRPVGPSALVFSLLEREVYLVERGGNGSLERLYLDPAGVLLGGEIWQDGEGLRFTFAKVRQVGEILFPGEITFAQLRRPVTVTVTYQAVELNPPLPDHLFTLPLSSPPGSQDH